MKKIVFTIMAMLLTVLVTAQNRSATLEQTTLNKTGETFKDVFFDASDTINEGETYYVEFTCKKNYPQEIDVYLAGSDVSGSGDVVITVWGKKFVDSDYISLGTTTWNSTGVLDEVISIGTPLKYRFFKVAFVSDGTAKQVLVTDVRFKTYFVSGVLAGTSIHLSGTLEVDGESTFNDHVNLSAGADLILSATSDIIINTDAFTAEGSTGDVGVGNDITVTNDIILLNGAVVGIAGNEIITFNAAGSINFTGATVDVDGAFSASSVASDGIVSGTAITGTAEANFTNNAAAVTFGAVATDADVVLAFDAVTAQGSITYMEDEDRFDFDNAVDVIGALTANTIESDGPITGTSIISPLYDATGAVQITFGSTDVTSFKYFGMTEDLIWTPSSTPDTWTISSSTGADIINFGSFDFTSVGDITSGGLITSEGLRFEHATSTDAMALPAYFSETLSDQFGNASFPAFGMTVYSKILGNDLAATKAYEAGIAGLYGITGTNASNHPKTAVLGWIMDNTTTADAAFIALIDGDTQITQAGAAYGVRYLNSTSTSEFGYGLDLYSAAIDAYLPVTYANADIRLVNEATIDNTDDGIINFTVDTLSLNGVALSKTMVKSVTVGWDGASGTDFKWTGDADHNEQSLDLGAIIPAQARVIAVEVVCTETVVGVTDITLGVGNATGGAQFIVAISCDDANEVAGIIDPDLPAVVVMNWASATDIWLIGDPSDNTWGGMSAGLWTVYVTYIQY